MAEISRVNLFGKLNPIGYKAIESATVYCKLRGNPYVELVHWFQQILQLQDSDLHRIIQHFDINPSVLAKDMTNALDALPRGASSISDLSSKIEDSIERAWVYGSLVYGDSKVRMGYIILGMLKTRELKNSLLNISGEFAIRWMTAVLTCTPFFILFGISNLFVRQAMGIATAFWSILHFIIFIAAEGLIETFNQVNYIAGFVAVLILIPLLFTSNRKSMKLLKSNWKKLQRFAYVAILLSLFHVILLEKTIIGGLKTLANSSAFVSFLLQRNCAILSRLPPPV